MPVSEFCKLDVVCCEANTSIQEVAALMRIYHVGDVIVIGKNEETRVPIGIVTDRDIVIEAIAPQVDINILTAGDIMSSPLTAIQENESLFDALRLMHNRRVRRLPVVREDGTLYGIVTADDMINMLVDELSMMTEVLAEQPAVESRTRR